MVSHWFVKSEIRALDIWRPKKINSDNISWTKDVDLIDHNPLNFK